MKILKDIKQIEEVLNSTLINPPNALNSTFGYKDSLIFECGCQEKSHKVNDKSLSIIGSAPPVKFLMLCKNNYVSFFRVKGLFKITVDSYWSCELKKFQKVSNLY